MFTLTLHESDRVFRFPVFTWQLYFCEGTTQITPVAKSSDQRGYTTTWEVLELLALLLPFHLLLHLNPQQMGSLGFQLELGPTYWSVTSLTTVNLSRTETNPKEIVCYISLFFYFPIFTFNSHFCRIVQKIHWYKNLQFQLHHPLTSSTYITYSLVLTSLRQWHHSSEPNWYFNRSRAAPKYGAVDGAIDEAMPLNQGPQIFPTS